MWIKLHLQNGNQITYIQTQHITHLNKTMGGTVAVFLSDGNVCVVNETIDEISRMITE